jgi:hypothetical protein
MYIKTHSALLKMAVLDNTNNWLKSNEYEETASNHGLLALPLDTTIWIALITQIKYCNAFALLRR